MQKLGVLTVLLFCSSLLILCSFTHANQGENLHRLLESKRSLDAPASDSWRDIVAEVYSPANMVPQEDGVMQADKIQKLPGQPCDVDFNQYSGYVTVDQHSGKALFYYFVESPENSSTKPLLLWLNGGPGCSSLGYGAMQELGPFGVKSDGKTLYRNKYAWNNVANVLFLESPVGVGFSYSNKASDYDIHGDKQTAKDSYVFLVNWLERFPSYRNREFYITGESYAGHYVPQLAYTILQKNKNANQTTINLKGIAIGNAFIDSSTTDKGAPDFFWTHALISDETYEGIKSYCNSQNQNLSDQCLSYESKVSDEIGSIYIYNIYAPAFCQHPLLKNGSISPEKTYGPCSDSYTEAYLNIAEVQTALHAKPTDWSACSAFYWKDSPDTVLPIIQNLFSNNISVWIYSGDMDGVIPVTASRYAIRSLKLPVETPWRPWYTKDEVGGYVEGYQGVTFVTVRGSGHLVPSDQPQRALAMISAFLQGILPPSS